MPRGDGVRGPARELGGVAQGGVGNRQGLRGGRGNFIDTANQYADGESERIVGDLIGSERDRWVLATKYTLSTDRNDPNAGGSHRKSLRRAIEAEPQAAEDGLHRPLLGAHLGCLHACRGGHSFTRRPRAFGEGADVGSRTLPRGWSRAPSPLPRSVGSLHSPRSKSPTAWSSELLRRAAARRRARCDLAVTGWGPLGGGPLDRPIRV